MADKIFLVGDDGNLRPMVERSYESEDLLQSLLERYHDLLAGDQMNEDSPRRWLLIKREMGVPDAKDANDRWSLDHLFLDQDGVLTLVEVKRATDTRARREVVAQMLDYAANAVLYWPIESIIASFEATAREGGRDPGKVLAAFLTAAANGGQGEDDGAIAERFWQQVKTNLEAERIRMVFVADIIPRELQRIVEFLNGQMRPSEVIAVEVKQFAGDRLRTLVPRVIGLTAKSEGKSKAAPREGRRWDKDSFDAVAADGETLGASRRIIDWFTANAAGTKYGNGKAATFTARALIHGEDTEILRVYADGSLYVGLGRFPDEAFREEFRRRLLDVPGIELSGKGTWPSANLAPLNRPEVWEKFAAVLRWLIGARA
jgi:hypothetical protein